MTPADRLTHRLHFFTPYYFFCCKVTKESPLPVGYFLQKTFISCHFPFFPTFSFRCRLISRIYHKSTIPSVRTHRMAFTTHDFAQYLSQEQIKHTRLGKRTEKKYPYWLKPCKRQPLSHPITPPRRKMSGGRILITIFHNTYYYMLFILWVCHNYCTFARK